MIKVYKSEKGKKEIIKTYDILLSKWGIAYSEIDIDTRYGSTHIITAGKIDNPPLVLFHGVGDDSAMMWVYNAKAWSSKYRIYAIDTIGGPGKSVPNEYYNENFDMLLWVDDVLKELDIKKANFAGVSNGAYITQSYGARRPSKCIKLVCMAGGLTAGDKSPGLWDMIQTFKVFFPEALFPTKKNLIKLITKLCGANLYRILDDKDIISHWYALIRYFNNMAMGYYKLIPLSGAEVSNMRDNSLFIIGDKDPIAYGEKAVNILKENQMEFIIINGAGHAVNHEFSNKVNEMVLDFLSR